MFARGWAKGKRVKLWPLIVSGSSTVLRLADLSIYQGSWSTVYSSELFVTTKLLPGSCLSIWKASVEKCWKNEENKQSSIIMNIKAPRYLVCLSLKESPNYLLSTILFTPHLSGHHGAEGDDAPSSDGGVTQQQRPQDGGGDIWKIQQINIPTFLFFLARKRWLKSKLNREFSFSVWHIQLLKPFYIKILQLRPKMLFE